MFSGARAALLIGITLAGPGIPIYVASPSNTLEPPTPPPFPPAVLARLHGDDADADRVVGVTGGRVETYSGRVAVTAAFAVASGK
jgi:hypothetical protein